MISPLNCICLRKFLPSSSGSLPLYAIDLPPSIKTCSFTKERYSPSGEESISHLEEAVLQIMTRCTSTQVGTQCRNQRSHDRDKFLRTYFYCFRLDHTSNLNSIPNVVLDKQSIKFLQNLYIEKTLARTFEALYQPASGMLFFKSMTSLFPIVGSI